MSLTKEERKREAKLKKRRSPSLAAAKKSLIGRGCSLPLGGLEFACKIVDLRKAFGRVDVCIAPQGGGTGTHWVTLESVVLPPGVRLP